MWYLLGLGTEISGVFKVAFSSFNDTIGDNIKRQKTKKGAKHLRSGILNITNSFSRLKWKKLANDQKILGAKQS